MACRVAAVAVALTVSLGDGPSAALADHTDPAQPLSPVDGAVAEGAARGAGRWAFVRNFPANPGTDLGFWERGDAAYASTGTLGGGATGRVGQRVLRLVGEDGRVNPGWMADHGSAACQDDPSAAGNLKLQHDVQLTPRRAPELLIDTTDDVGRCHDLGGGGLELIDVSGVGVPGGPAVREIHLTRHDGMSHTVTVDDTRPWIVYNSNGDFAGRAWIDVLDLRTCLGHAGTSLEERRASCRPVVARIPFEADWASQRLPDGTLGDPTSCHDISVRGPRLYCAALNATLILDVAELTDGSGAIRGTPLPCRVISGSSTSAAVTDCTLAADDPAEAIAAYDALGRPQAEGWRFLGTVNHPGRDDGEGGQTGLNNVRVPADEGVSISHQAESTPPEVGEWLLVTDERGGGLVAPGASCEPGLDNPIGNGGIHVFDITDPAAPVYALGPDGRPAVFIADATVPAETFCTVHVIHHLPDEQRLVAAWYSQGIKIIDYAIDESGRWTFTETASFLLPGARTWAADVFRTDDHPDGTRTYWLLSNDMVRGADVLSWTGPANPIPTTTPGTAPPPPPTTPASTPTPTPTPTPIRTPTATPGRTDAHGAPATPAASDIPRPVAAPTAPARPVTAPGGTAGAVLALGAAAALGGAAWWGRRRLRVGRGPSG